MTRGQKCDNCQKKFNYDEDDFYVIKFYHGAKDADLFSCSVCYQSKKEEYLENYSVISFMIPFNGIVYVGKEIKASHVDCYAGKKDQKGQILKQQDCRHCQPWEDFSRRNQENNVKNKGIPTEMKVLGIVVLILVFISGVVLGKFLQKSKNKGK